MPGVTPAGLNPTIMRKNFIFLISLLVIASNLNYVNASTVIPYSMPSTVDPDPAVVRGAVAELKSLSKKDKKIRIREAKKELKAFKAEKKAGKEPSTNTLLLVILAILLPPLAVYLHEGVINNRFWISLLLTLLFWLPGVIYALIIILGND